MRPKLDPQIVKEAQQVMLKLLKQFDSICRENHLQYWLDSGTLLGAVRHKGFIPWDDDVDVCMMREDYEKFLEIAPALLPNDMFIQNIYSDHFYMQNWSKVMDKNSLCRNTIEPVLHHQGIYIDIFPMDKLSTKAWVRHIFRKSIRRVYGVCGFITKFRQRSIRRPLFSLRNIMNNTKVVIVKKFLAKSKFPNRRMGAAVEKSLRKYITVQSENKDRFVIGFGISLHLKPIFSYDTIYPLKEMIFEDQTFFVPNDCDTYLKAWYGDTYMQLPEEEKRRGHSYEIIPHYTETKSKTI